MRQEWRECRVCDIQFMSFDRSRKLCTDCWIFAAKVCLAWALVGGLVLGYWRLS